MLHQALEDGEDLQELTDKTRERKERRATNKLLKEAEVSNRGTPASDTESRGRRGRKAKSKLNSDEPAAGSKRKRGAMKSMSVTPSIAEDDDDDDERDQVHSNLNNVLSQLAHCICRKDEKPRLPNHPPPCVRR